MGFCDSCYGPTATSEDSKDHTEQTSLLHKKPEENKPTEKEELKKVQLTNLENLKKGKSLFYLLIETL
jgi:hypothetical protein